MTSPGKTIVVMPAYNAETTLEQTLSDMPQGAADEIILVDDCSKDGTAELARSLGLTVIEHERNTGYGANQKTCYREALKRGADVIIMIHPDYQYDSSLVAIITELLQKGHCDVLLGNRIRSRHEALAGGMPFYKYVANRGLTIIENVWLGQNLGEFHSGMRGYRREVLETIPWESNSDDFVFDSQFLVQAVHFGFRLGDIPVPVRYMKEASSINLGQGTIYGLRTLETLLTFSLHRAGIVQSPLFQERKTAN
ncbi:MAG: glycosyl transferase family 2 [Latescibacteria bacterium DG_63]|nr:MAG: glycosyl transferase family 2 [Latescibacteria bacterium DG_63]